MLKEKVIDERRILAEYMNLPERIDRFVKAQPQCLANIQKAREDLARACQACLPEMKKRVDMIHQVLADFSIGCNETYTEDLEDEEEKIC